MTEEIADIQLVDLQKERKKEKRKKQYNMLQASNASWSLKTLKDAHSSQISTPIPCFGDVTLS